MAFQDYFKTLQQTIVSLASHHGFSAYIVSDMVLIYIDGTFEGKETYFIEAVSTIRQTYIALGY